MSALKLASCGDDIKVWDTNNFSIVRQFNPHDQNISSIAWNGKKSTWNSDNLLLCSASSKSDKICFTAVKDTAVTVTEFDSPAGSLCVDFNSTSSYLLVGGTDSCINVWDLKSRKIKKQYKDHKGPVTCAQFNCNDTYIASGSETGEIILFNVVTGQGCSPMVAPKCQTVRQIQYSKFRKSLLGSVSDDGAVNLWDINTRRLLHSFSSSHIAPATGLNFSPINDILLMSVGLDKRIVCYDTQGKKPVKTMTAENPLTSIDVMSDGATVAVGSTRGIIYLYDLRHGNAPMKTINAHKSSVQNVKFQHGLVHEPSGAKSASSAAISPNRRQLPSAPLGKSGHNKDFSEHNNINNHSDGAAEEDVFSPVRNDFGNNSADFRTDTVRSDSMFNTNSYHSNDSSGGVFSPLADGDSISRRYGDKIKISPLVINSSPSVTRRGENMSSNVHHQFNGDSHNDVAVRQNLEYNDSYHRGESDGHPFSKTRDTSDRPEFDRAQRSTDSRNSNFSNNLSNHKVHPAGTSYNDITQQSPQPTGNSPKQSPSTRPQSIHNSRTESTYSQGFTADSSASVSQNFSASKKLDDSPSGSAGGQGHSPIRTSGTPEGAHAVSLTSNGAIRRSQEISASDGSVPQNFQTQFIRNMIEDSMEEFKEQIHNQYLNLHLEMIRQFQIQQNEMTHLMQQYSVNHDLIREIERLKEENQRLKKNF
ncbi:protein NEDD1-like [Mytilus galloprovincialis]|uniref:protein NEDD1-like n=1 Tax=Mytilus galloprovincialis TaxID=29158 RepID=UPI003F7C0691